MSTERLKTAQFNLKNKRVFLSAVAKYLTEVPDLLSIIVNGSRLKLWREARNSACIGSKTGNDHKVIADKLAKWFDVGPIMCGDCGEKEATGECGYGRCGGSICEDCTVDGLCKFCNR